MAVFKGWYYAAIVLCEHLGVSELDHFPLNHSQTWPWDCTLYRSGCGLYSGVCLYFYWATLYCILMVS